MTAKPCTGFSDKNACFRNTSTEIPTCLLCRSKPTPISQGVAFLVSKDQITREHLLENISQLCAEFIENVQTYSVTEIAAWCEICRKVDFGDKNLAETGKLMLRNAALQCMVSHKIQACMGACKVHC